MDLDRLTGGLFRRLEETLGELGGALFEPVVRLGVTGLSRAGKTVFITSLVANLLDRGRMPQLRAAAEGRILAAYLQPQPDHTIPRFAYEDHLAALTGPEPHWPESTRSISTLRLSLRVAPTGLLAGLDRPARRAPRHRRLPRRVAARPAADEPGLRGLVRAPPSPPPAPRPARRTPRPGSRGSTPPTPPARSTSRPPARLAAAFTAYLAAARAAGLSSVAPGRFLMPGDLEGSPALTFSPLARPERRASRLALARLRARFEAYKRVVVDPFFRNHFARLDRQIVLIDALGAIHDGPRAVEDLRAAMAEILACFRPGPRSWLAPILGRRIDRILFAATKADHLHHSPARASSPPSPRRWSRTPAPAPQFSGAETRALSIASLRATVEETVTRDGREIDVVRGRLARHRRRGRALPRQPARRPGARSSPPPARAPPTGPTPPTASPASPRRGCARRRRAACRTSASTAPPSS